jgi:4-alpha-glucanotransferase
MQDWTALSSRYTDRPANRETINDPTNKRHYWRYRMHHLLDDLLLDSDLIGCIQQLHLATGRAAPDDAGMCAYSSTY